MAGSTGTNLLGQAYLRVRVDSSLLAEGLASVRSVFLGTLQEMAGVAGGILAAAGVESVTRGLKDLAMQFVSTNDQLQQFHVSLDKLFNSEMVAADMLQQIQDMAAKTPFVFKI